MKRNSENQRIKKLVDYIKNYDLYEKLFIEIDKEIQRSLEREKKKFSSGKDGDFLPEM